MPLINPDELPRVALEASNEIHLEEVGLVNELSDLLDACDGSDAALDVINEKFEGLIEHTKDHFGFEEERMIEAQFPAYPMHKAEHDRQLAMVSELKAHWDATRDVEALKLFVQRQLPEWVTNHILTMDTVTSLFLVGELPQD